MGTNGITNLSRAEIAKLALAKKGVNTSATQKPAWMTAEGSIYNAPKPETKEEPKSVKDLKSLDVNNIRTKSECERALQDIETYSEQNPLLRHILNGKKEELVKKKNQLSQNASQQNLNNIANGTSTSNASSAGAPVSANGTDDKMAQAKENAKNISASQGRQMAADMKKQQANVEAQTKTTEKNTQTANKYSQDAQKDQKALVKQQKTLEKQNKAATKQIQQNQAELTALTETMNRDQEEVDALQTELQSLTAGDNTGVGVNSAFSLSLAGTEEYDQAAQNDPNSQRIAELQSQIAGKTSSMTTTGARIGKLQTSTNKQIKTMHKVSIKYMANVQTTQKSLEANQSASEKILDVANKVEQISTLVAQGGMALKYTGMGLIALGQATSWCFGAGAALIAAGTVMQKVGTVAEIAGQYGQAAAGVTKTACYAAQGNLAGALTSAGSAIMSGATAVKGTKELGATFQQISDKATEATQKLGANVAAREAVKNMSDEELGNLTKKQATKLAREGAMQNLQGQSADAIKASFKDGANSVVKDGVTSTTVKGAAVAGAETAVNTATDVTATMSKDAIKKGIKNGTIRVGANATTIVQEAAKEVEKESMANLFTFDNMMKAGKSLQTAGGTMAAKMGALGGGTAAQGRGRGQSVTPYAPVSASSLAYLNKMNARMAARQGAFSRMYA